jgi:hypothetical protein
VVDHVDVGATRLAFDGVVHLPIRLVRWDANSVILSQQWVFT